MANRFELMKKTTFLRMAAVMSALAAAALSCVASGLDVEIGSSRSIDSVHERTDAAVRRLNLNFAILSAQQRALRGDHRVLSLPSTVFLTQNGSRLPPAGGRGRGDSITLVFDSSGGRAFPPDYAQLLLDTYLQAKPTLDTIFGDPSLGGLVHVANFDADIGDRDAIAGGYYLPNNGQGQQEIRFPIYNSPEAAAINFLHTLLLAYIGPNVYPWDAFNEGLVRAATMRVARTPGALLSTLDPSKVEEILDSSYDIGPAYDWNNQRALGSPLFIAPNLRQQQLPIGGATGGLYLLRYQMAGSAWQKVLVEYPSFARVFNQAYYANPSAYSTREALIVLGQNVLISLGGSNGLVEGLAFADWVQRQFILETDNIVGTKLLVQPFAITDNLTGSDFGVFGIQAHWFNTSLDGNETLLSGTSFPIFWSPDFNRIFTSAQEDRMSIAFGYGSVAPNFPDSFSAEPYRVTVDIPIEGRIARAYLPAGAIATTANTTPNNVYGTITGFVEPTSTVTYKVRITWPGGISGDIPINNFAFGARVFDPSFLNSQPLTVNVIQAQAGSEQVLYSRRVNKGPGPIELDLRLDEIGTYTFALPKGLSMIGFPNDPFISSPSRLLGFADNQTLAARWNPTVARYDIYPDFGSFRQGESYFIRSDVAKSVGVDGRSLANTALAIALKPGWNMLTIPLRQNSTSANIQVVVGTEFPKTFAQAVGTDVAGEFFTFAPGPNDPVTGVPETGTMVQATTLAAGQGYYFKVFAPDGATLLFSPSARGRQGGGDRDRNRWRMNLDLQGGFERCQASIGQASDATAGFDKRRDSELPPTAGGLQMGAGTSTLLYRDMRRFGRAETYRVRVSGIRRGTSYSLKFMQAEGWLDHFEVRDLETGIRRLFLRPGTYRFVGRSTAKVFEVKVAGR